MNMLSSAKFSPIKDTINTLIEQIMTIEDQIKEIETNPLYLTSISDLAKNKESILLLKQFIKNETLIASKKVTKKNSEVSSLKSQLDLLQLNLDKEVTVYTQRDLDQELIKHKCFEKTIELHNTELVSLIENLNMLKEEKLTIEYDIVNQMSLKETYEELIKANSQLMFKNLIMSHDNNISASTSNLVSLSRPIEVEDYEMTYVSMSKVVSIVYDALADQISSLQSFDKSIIVSIISQAYGQYLTDRSFDFFRDITQEIVNSNPKFRDFIVPETFKKMIKLCIKSSAFDKIISNKIAFLNTMYKPRKNELLKEIRNSKEKIDKIRHKSNEAAIEVDKRRVYLNSTKAKEELTRSIKEIECELKQINAETQRNVFNYENQIKDLEKINKLLEEKYSSEKNKSKVNQLKKSIDEIFYQIKNTIKGSEHSDEVLDRFIKDLNRTTRKGGKNGTKNTKPMRTLKLATDEEEQDNDSILLSDNDFIIEDIEEKGEGGCKDAEERNIANHYEDNHCEDNHLDLSKEATSLEFSNTQVKNTSHSNLNTGIEIEGKYFINNDDALLNESSIQTPPNPLLLQPSSFKIMQTLKTNESIPLFNLKLSSLYKATDCYSYLQELNDALNQFNPLITPDIIPEEEGFTQSTISLSEDNHYIIIKLLNKELKKISISLLDKTLVTGSMKKVLTVVQLFSHLNNVKQLLQSPQIKELNLTKEEIVKATSNKYYHITMILTISKKISLLFLKYETFKQWVNGLAYIIKNKDFILNN